MALPKETANRESKGSLYLPIMFAASSLLLSLLLFRMTQSQSRERCQALLHKATKPRWILRYTNPHPGSLGSTTASFGFPLFFRLGWYGLGRGPSALSCGRLSICTSNLRSKLQPTLC
eukprot:5731550-Amphidinium_carterae.1